MSFVKTYNNGMFAILKIYQYITINSSKQNFDMNLFKNCNLDTKFTCNKRCLLEYSVMNYNYDIVKILLKYNCNLIDNDSFVFSIIYYLNADSKTKKTSFEIFKLLLYKLKENRNDTKNIIKKGLQRILRETKECSKLVIYIMNFYPNILKYSSIYYHKYIVNPNHLYLLENSSICLKFNRKKFKYYDKNIKESIKIYLMIMNKLDCLPQELTEYILNFVELYKLKLKLENKYLKYY